MARDVEAIAAVVDKPLHVREHADLVVPLEAGDRRIDQVLVSEALGRIAVAPRVVERLDVRAGDPEFLRTIDVVGEIEMNGADDPGVVQRAAQDGRAQRAMEIVLGQEPLDRFAKHRGVEPAGGKRLARKKPEVRGQKAAAIRAFDGRHDEDTKLQ